MKVELRPGYINSVSVSHEDIESYKKDGFLIAKNLVPMSTISQIRSDAINIFKKQLSRLGYSSDTYEEFEQQLYKFFQEDQEAFINCGKQIQHLVSLHKLSLSNHVLDVVKQLGLTNINIATRPVLFFNHPKLATNDVYHTVPAHQDAKSMGGSLDSIVVWFPLVNVDENLGALQVVPRSHTYGLMTSSVLEGFGLVDKYTNKDFISVPLNVGDALFFSSYLVHRSGNNVTDTIRWSCHLRYSNLDDQDFINRKYPHPYIYKPITKEV